MRNLDLYNEFFPQIPEEKPEEKINEANKDETEKNNPMVVSNMNLPHNDATKLNETNTNVNVQNNTNVEEITKKVKEEFEEEKKKIEMKHQEEIEKLKSQLALLQTQNEELTKVNMMKTTQIQNEANQGIQNSSINNNENNNNNNDNNEMIVNQNPPENQEIQNEPDKIENVPVSDTNNNAVVQN